MKKNFTIALIFIICVIISGCAANNSIDEEILIRIHIRANSNVQADQNIKLKVRDEIVKMLEGDLSSCSTTSEAHARLSEMLDSINSTAEKVLVANGYNYGSKTRLNNEFFPTRDYGGQVVASGYYDALIIELGSGTGDNWWCVIYPPLCFVEGTASSSFEYKSKIAELWEKYFGKQS